MPKWNFVEAEREPGRLIIAQAGRSGTGKTFTALLLASGICDVSQGRIAFIDTEDKRAKRYAPDPKHGYPGFKFAHCPFPAPYNPAAYMEIFEDAAAYAAPHGVVVIDSMSHEHEGIGGVLEMHEAELVRMMKGREDMREKLSFSAWAKPKAERQRLIQAIERSPVHVIMCFRAKDKKGLGKDRTGKTVVVERGAQPITGDDWPYYADVSFLLDGGRPIIGGYDAGKLPDPMIHLIDQRRPLTRADGQALGRYAFMVGSDGAAELTLGESKAMVDGFVRQIQDATEAAELVEIKQRIAATALPASTKEKLNRGIHAASQKLPEKPIEEEATPRGPDVVDYPDEADEDGVYGADDDREDDL